MTEEAGLGLVDRLLNALVDTRSFPEVASQVLGAIADAVGCQAAAMWVPDGSTAELRPVAFWGREGMTATTFEAATRARRFGKGEGLPGRVWETGEPAWIADLSTDTNFPRAPAAAADGIRSGFAFPLRAEADLVGVVELFTHEVREPDEALLTTMASFGAALGQALERRRTSEQVRLDRERLALALDAAQLGTWEWDARLGRVTWSTSTEEIMGAPPNVGDTAGALANVHPDDRHHVMRAITEAIERGGSFEAEMRVPVLRRWVETKGRAIVGDSGEVVGLIGLVADITSRKDAEEASRAAADYRARLHAVASALAGAFTIDEVVGVVLSECGRAVGAAQSVLAVVSDDGEHLDLAGGTYEEPFLRPWTRIPLDLRVPLTEAVRGRALVVVGSREEFVARYPDQLGLLQADTQALAAVPLMVKDRPVGALGLSFDAPTAFDEVDREFVLTLAGQCALAVERARLYEAERRARTEADANGERVEFLAQAGERLALSLDVAATVESMVELVVPRLADWCAVTIVEDDGSVRRAAIRHRDPALDSLAAAYLEERPPEPGRSRITEVLESGEPFVMTDVDDSAVEGRHSPERAAMLRRLGASSAMVLPLVARGRVLGALTLLTGPERRYGPADLRLAQELARRAALALDNARLFLDRSMVAHKLQETLLPRVLPTIPGVSLAARYLAAGESSEVGGDFYDVFHTAHERWAVVIGDVCGRGADAAGVTALARYTLRAVALRDSDPITVMGALNRAILDETASDERFFTLAFAELRLDGGNAGLRVACGGHPPPLVVRAGGRVDAVGRPGTLLGVLAEPEFEEDRATLHPGDAVVFYTDGVTEARGPNGMLGDEGLRELLGPAAGLPAADLADRVADAVVEYRGDGGQDDMAVLVLRLDPPAPG